MAVTFEIDRDNDLTLFKISGNVLVRDLIEAIEEYLELGGTIFEIFDFSRFSGDGYSNDDITLLSDFLILKAPKATAPGKTAVIAKRHIDFGNFRMLSSKIAHAVPYKLKVFRDLSQAFEWFEFTPGV